MGDREEYGEVIKKFFGIYGPLQKKYGLRLHTSFDIQGNGLIEVWEHRGIRRVKCVCKVKKSKGESITGCYKRAIEMLESYGEGKENVAHEKEAV